ncbi:unnamed protein product [Rhizophagus irregularis]|nr:unnamed protein product [Rhizophagus irregularis]
MEMGIFCSLLWNSLGSNGEGRQLTLQIFTWIFVLQTASSGNLKLLLKKRFLSLDGFWDVLRKNKRT